MSLLQGLVGGDGYPTPASSGGVAAADTVIMALTRKVSRSLVSGKAFEVPLAAWRAAASAAQGAVGLAARLAVRLVLRLCHDRATQLVRSLGSTDELK